MSASGMIVPVDLSNLYVQKAGVATVGLWYGTSNVSAGPFPFWSIKCYFTKVVGCSQDSQGRTQCATQKKVVPGSVGVVEHDNIAMAQALGLSVDSHWYAMNSAPWDAMGLNGTHVKAVGCARWAAIV